MSEQVFETVGEKGHIILTAVNNGCGNVRDIREVTTLTIGTVNYRLSKLEDLGLIELGKSEGRETSMINGQIREYDTPKPVELTDLGEDYFEWTDRQQDLQRYYSLSREELVELIHDHDQRIDRLESAVEMLRNEFQQKSGG